PAFHRIGALLLERGSEQEAESAFRQAVTLAPELPHGYIGLAKVALRADDMHKVIKLLTRALKLEPRSRTAHYLLGTAYRRLGRRADAERELRRGADAKKRYMPTEWSRRIPEHAMGVPFQIRQAQRYLHNGRRKRAIEVLETVLKWHPDCVEALNDLAVVHMRQREPVKARELLQKALKFDKTSAVTYINLGASYLDTAEPDEALRHLDRAIELSPTTAQAHITRAVALLRLRRVAEAAEAQKTAVGLDPQNPAFHMDLGNTLVLLRRYAEAKEQYETVIVQTPDSVEAHLRLCAVSIALGDEERAASSLAEARRLAPNHPKVKTLARKLEALRK
ncbi:MAG: tetratricopeptide repeat protein, partial [Phycisphaerae bacterium]